MSDAYAEIKENRLAARLTVDILDTLDKYAPTYFDDCFEESSTLFNKLDERIRETLREILAE